MAICVVVDGTSVAVARPYAREAFHEPAGSTCRDGAEQAGARAVRQRAGVGERDLRGGRVGRDRRRPLFRVRPPRAKWCDLGRAGGVRVLAAMATRSSAARAAHDAAVAIDEKLALKEKFSTALYARPLE